MASGAYRRAPVTPLAFCTVVAKNYLPRARVLVDSLRAHHPGATVYVLLADAPEGRFDPAQEPFTCLQLQDLDLPRPRELTFRYGVVELCTAVRPFLFRMLLGRGHERLVYLDPDMRVYAPLDQALRALDHANVVLTPHLCAPLEPSERHILVCGAYNLGFLGLHQGAAAEDLLAWLCSRLLHECLFAPAQGLFVDQRWMDLAAGLVDGVHVLRDPGYNVGHWNISQRTLTGSAAKPLVNGVPLALFHYSGFDPARPERLSRHADEGPAVEPLATMLASYAREVFAKGEEAAQTWTYTHGFFSDGQAIPEPLRAVFRDEPVGRFPDPFDVSGDASFRRFATRESGPPPLASTPVAVAEATVAWDELAPAVRVLVESREDVRRAYETSDGRLRWPGLLGWLRNDGVGTYGLRPEWCEAWGGVDESRLPRLLALFDQRSDLQARFPMAFVEEHDAPAFADWMSTHRVEIQWTNGDVDWSRQLLAERSVARIREIVGQRADVAAAYPGALAVPEHAGFLGWLQHSGPREHGLNRDTAGLFARSQAQHVCLRVHAAYSSRPEWREAHPHGLTPRGRRRFLAWLQAAQAPELGPFPDRVSRLCPPDAIPPLAELARDFPETLESASERERVWAFLREEERTGGMETAWVRGVEDGLHAQGLLDHGATVIGYFRAGFGLGELARATVRALQAVDYPVTLVSTEHAPAWQAAAPPDDTRVPRPFSIVHLNPDGVHKERARLGLEERPGRHHRIGYWAWELEEMPPEWREAFADFDEVWTCSRHAAASLTAWAPVPVQTMWPCVEEDPATGVPRVQENSAFTFLFIYDQLSETARKNPLGLLQAFRRAFRPDDRVRLVLKTANGALRPEAMKQVQDAAADLPVLLPVQIIDEHMPRAGVLSLLRDSDAYVSLHRAEGFGLTLAEAMSAGKPVIATYYSGNVDFMTPWNSFPVPYSLVEIASNEGPYPRGGVWAEPDLEAAAHLMRHVFERREEAKIVAARGQADIRRLLSPRVCGERLQERLIAIRRHGLGRRS